MSELKNSTYWKKNGVVVEANSFVEDEQLRKDGWIKSDSGGYEWYKRSLAKQPPAAELTAANDNRDTGWPQRDLDELGFSAMELPPAAETGARGEDVSDWGIHPTQRELEAYGDGYAAGLLDGPQYAPLMNEIAALREQLAAAQAERDAAVGMVNKAHKVLQDVERNLPQAEPSDIMTQLNYALAHSAWKAGAWIRNYWLHLSEQKQATGARGEVSPTVDDVLRAGVAAADRALALEAELASVREQLAAAQAAKATVAEIANDYRDQIWVHQGTLRVLKSWLRKEDGFSAEDGFTEASILGVVERDLEASERMDTRTLQATGGEVAE